MKNAPPKVLLPFLLSVPILTFAVSATAFDEVVHISREEAYGVLKPASDVDGKPTENPSGLIGKLVTGYQGWFRAEGDGSGLGFQHYRKGRHFEPGRCTIDLWPDLSEFDADERYATAFQHQDGLTAEVFSSVNPKTVDRHFRWMDEYGIDTAFVQRFASHGAKEHRDHRGLKYENQKLMLCRDAALQNNGSWVLMYDLSGLKDDDFERLAEDWKNLRRKMQLGTDPNDSSYLHVNGKPLVAIWGVGFSDDREYSLSKSEWFIRLLKENPEWGGMSIMLGVPYYWREQKRDATDDPNLHRVVQLADVISPWSVGRYAGNQDFTDGMIQHQRTDRQWCKDWKIDYLPVLWPGFSWKNLKGEDTSQIGRDKGRFLWRQFLATLMSGGSSAYVAMFDEMDEGTAIFKCTNDPPVGASKFQTYEGLSSDFYLRLCNEGGKLLRGELPVR